jgi:hypothetical protein
MEKKYTVLRIIATLYKIAGVLIALGTVLVVILVIVGGFTSSQVISEFSGINPGPIYTFLAVIITFIGGALSAIGVYAIGEALYLLIGLEENTRFTAILLRDRFYPQPQVLQAPLQPQPVMPPQPIVTPSTPPYTPPGN